MNISFFSICHFFLFGIFCENCDGPCLEKKEFVDDSICMGICIQLQETVKGTNNK
jgi:hypothetical protein